MPSINTIQSESGHLNSYFPLVLLLLFFNLPCLATDYYFHPVSGDDQASGTTIQTAFRSLLKITTLDLKAGDHILLAAGEVFHESLILSGVEGSHNAPILVTSYKVKERQEDLYSLIDVKGLANAVLIENSSFISIQNLKISASGKGDRPAQSNMRVGVMIRLTEDYYSRSIALERLQISDVFFEDEGFQRGKDEVRTANGTQKYGWGIRLMNQTEYGIIEDVSIMNCAVSNVAHTGIKLTGGEGQNIRDIKIGGNKVTKTGGPGIQMSRVKLVHVANNEVSYTGSVDDSRKWGRGSGRAVKS